MTVGKYLRSFFWFCSIFCFSNTWVYAQIARDPQHHSKMVYQDQRVRTFNRTIQKPVVMIGPGDPEDLFYNHPRKHIDLLKSRNAQCTYVAAYLHDFGGGSPGAGKQFDVNLEKWDEYITELEHAGITTVFFFLDDSYKLPDDWKLYFGKIVDKLKHHKLLIWSIVEEYSERLSKEEVEEIGAFIRERDPVHIIGVHQHFGTAFDFNSSEVQDMFAMQYNVDSDTAIYNGVYAALLNTGGKRIINLSEVANHAKQDRVTMRKWNWAAIMGGASIVQILWMGRATDSEHDWNHPDKYKDCRTMSDFLEKTDFNIMLPRQEFAAGGTKWLLAKPGSAYLAYADELTKDFAIKGLAKGEYDIKWLDIASGSAHFGNVNIRDGESVTSFVKPSGVGSEVAMYVQKRKPVNAEPEYALPLAYFDKKMVFEGSIVAYDDVHTTASGRPVHISLRMKTDLPGPFNYLLRHRPKHGTVRQDGNDWAYIPDPGFVGKDSVTFIVRDIRARINSKEATITIDVK